MNAISPPPEPVNDLGLLILESLGIALAILTNEGKVRYLNHPARQFIHDTHCFFLHQDGHLIPALPQPQFSRALQKLGLAPPEETAVPESLIVTNPLGHKFPLLLKAEQGINTTDILLFFPKKPRQEQPSPNLLADWYGLTRTEARLLAWLATGKPITMAAELCHITCGTARIHLKHILQKTGFHRQTDLLIDLHVNPSLAMAKEPSAIHSVRLAHADSSGFVVRRFPT